VPMAEIAAALAQLVQGKTPLLLQPPPPPPVGAAEAAKRHPKRDRVAASAAPTGSTEFARETFRIEVGHQHGVQPGNIVGAIANEAELEARYIGRIDIRGDYSLVDLPEGMPPELLEHLKKVRVAGRPLRMSRASEAD